MKVYGDIQSDGKWLSIAIPSISVFSQARKRSQVLPMVVDCLRLLLEQPKLVATIEWLSETEFSIAADDGCLLPLVLQSARLKKGMSIQQAAEKIGSRSANGWKRYEMQGCNPTIRQAAKLMRAVGLAYSVH